jgi:uncharacterized protein (TIGR02598 family)
MDWNSKALGSSDYLTMKSTFFTNQFKSKSKGFTLTECMLSVAITATGLLTVIGLLVGVLSESRDSRAMTISGMLVRQLAGEAREIMRENNPPREVILLVDNALQVIGHSRQSDGALNGAYSSGSLDPAASSFARLSRQDDRDNPLLEKITITVETPASAPAGQRRVFHYATLAAK